MGTVPASELMVQVALAIGLASLVLAGGMVLRILAMRRRRLRRQARVDRFLEVWRPRVYEAALGEPPQALPPLAAEDDVTFLLLWNQVQEGLRGPPRAGLNKLARTVGARIIALRRLDDADPTARLLSLRTLGHFGQVEDFERVAGYLDDRSPPIALAAARALARLDPRRAADALWPRLLSRRDWSMAQVATTFQEVEAARIGEALLQALPTLSPPDLQRLLPLVSLLDDARADVVVATLLATAQDPDNLAGALRHARSPALLDDVVRLARHPEWPVRTQAAAALGRLGDPSNRRLLIELLSDPQWWVRYRAAQALAAGRFGSREALGALSEVLPDRFARDMLAHVLAEGAR